jgi:hypothetical protein
MSAFGALESPASSGANATELARKSSLYSKITNERFDNYYSLLTVAFAEYFQGNNLDGIDIDFEDFSAINDGTAIDWMVEFMTVLAANVPPNTPIFHAPIAPWFV